MSTEGRATAPKIWRSRDGRHWEETGQNWEETGQHVDEADREWRVTLTPAAQDPETGRWAATTGQPVDVTFEARRQSYTEVSADPLAEPRIARLHTLITALLADYEEQMSRPHPDADELRTALENVAFIPDEARRRRQGAVWNARRR